MISWEHWFYGVAVGLVGACVGSFLNVVIHRWPRHLSLSEPKRSFCPQCKKSIPWFRNLPILTWFLQRGRCAECKESIPFHYVAVELGNVIWWVLAWRLFEPKAAVVVMFLGSALLVISLIDVEHTLIPVLLCWVCSALAIGVAWFVPDILQFTWEGGEMKGWSSLGMSILGFLLGYGILLLTVWFGKKAFGKRRMTFEQGAEESWELREPSKEGEELLFVLGEESASWGELFYRPSDCLEIKSVELQVDGQSVEEQEVKIFADRVEFGAKKINLEDVKSLRGRAKKVSVPREAMGGGDPPLLGMIGAFLGPQGVLFTLFASSVYALIFALLGRIGLGRQLPYGPFLALGAVSWLLGGWKFWQGYFSLLGF